MSLKMFGFQLIGKPEAVGKQYLQYMYLAAGSYPKYKEFLKKKRILTIKNLKLLLKKGQKNCKPLHKTGFMNGQ